MSAPANLKTVNMLEAKTHLSRLVAAVERGEEIVISRNGKAVARLVPHVSRKPTSPIGIAKGKFDIDWDAWFAMDAEIAASFTGSKLFPDEK